jgi:hypothetical protein
MRPGTPLGGRCSVSSAAILPQALTVQGGRLSQPRPHAAGFAALDTVRKRAAPLLRAAAQVPVVTAPVPGRGDPPQHSWDAVDSDAC